jgi:hypothetical protein
VNQWIDLYLPAHRNTVAIHVLPCGDGVPLSRGPGKFWQAFVRLHVVFSTMHSRNVVVFGLP